MRVFGRAVPVCVACGRVEALRKEELGAGGKSDLLFDDEHLMLVEGGVEEVKGFIVNGVEIEVGDRCAECGIGVGRREGGDGGEHETGHLSGKGRSGESMLLVVVVFNHNQLKVFVVGASLEVVIWL